MVLLHPLSKDSRPLIHSQFQQFPPEISEFTFTNLFAWRHTRPLWHAMIGDTLIFLSEPDPEKPAQKTIFGPPVGSIPLMEVLAALDPEVRGAVRIPANALPATVDGNLVFQEDRNNADYLYRVADLAELAGRNYSKKRNHIKQCLAHYSCEYETITADNLEECRDLQNRWCRQRECAKDPGLYGEYEAITETLNLLLPFNLIGGAIRVNGTLQAFSIAEPLNTDTAVCHFEKAMPEFTGLGQLITQWFTRNSLGAFTYVNREQDLGIPGLRRAKESYHPSRILMKYTLRSSNNSDAVANHDFIAQGKSTD